MSTRTPKHLFHVLEPSLWPFFVAFGLFFFVTGIAFLMYYNIISFFLQRK